MFTFSKPEQFYRLGKALFLAFAFFSAIICGQIRVNNLFHLAALLWLAGGGAWPPLLTQSRGPLMALVFMLVATMPYRQTDSGRESGCGSCCLVRWRWFSPSFTA